MSQLDHDSRIKSTTNFNSSCKYFPVPLLNTLVLRLVLQHFSEPFSTCRSHNSSPDPSSRTLPRLDVTGHNFVVDAVSFLSNLLGCLRFRIPHSCLHNSLRRVRTVLDNAHSAFPLFPSPPSSSGVVLNSTKKS